MGKGGSRETSPFLFVSGFVNQPSGKFDQFAPRKTTPPYIESVAPDQDRAEVPSAGHAPLFFHSAATKEFRKYDAQALPLGIVPDFNSEAPLALDLRAGDLLLLITDGFFEWENAAQEQFGYDRLGGPGSQARPSAAGRDYCRVVSRGAGVCRRDETKRRFDGRGYQTHRD
jgi:hypothetical protein